jgi:hypothetical protein
MAFRHSLGGQFPGSRPPEGGQTSQYKRVYREQLPTLVLTSPRSRDILGLFDILVDIGVPAEKEVIQ